jgi:hypothetical protein
LVLQAQVPGGVVFNAEVFADGHPVGPALYCCPECLCPPPEAGMPILLRLPGSGSGDPPTGLWSGIRDLLPGNYRLTARATADTGAMLEAQPVTIRVLASDTPYMELRASLQSDGILRFVLPEGSLLPYGFEMWVSNDLKNWQRLGPFLPGDVAAFFQDHPDPSDSRPRYYQARPDAGSARTGTTEAEARDL